MISQLLQLPAETPSTVSEGTQVLVSLIAAGAVIATAVLSYMGVRAARDARVEAQSTRVENSADHGRVAQALLDLVAEFRDYKTTTNHRFDELGQSIGAVREAHIRHLEHHVDKEDRTT